MDLATFLTSLMVEEKQKLFRLLAHEILGTSIENLTSVESFCYQNRDKMSTRLKNILLANEESLGKYIETIDATKIHKCRNASMNTEREFIKLLNF